MPRLPPPDAAAADEPTRASVARAPTLRAALAAAVARLTAAGAETPILEAELLLATARGGARLDVLRNLDAPLDFADAERFERLVAARCSRVPLAHLRGTQEFYGLDFAVSDEVLIPRPETELLVDLAIELLAYRPHARLVDFGVGSGAIAIAALSRLPRAEAIGVDVSPNALGVARRNAARHGVLERLLLVRAASLAAVAFDSVDLVVSNPPYIPTGDIPQLQPEVSLYEPRLALDGGADGLDCFRMLAEEAPRFARPGGVLAVEVGAGQADAVAGLFEAVGLRTIERRRDLAGVERVVVASRIR